MRITEKQLTTRVERWMSELEALAIGHWRLDSLEVVDSDDFWAAVLSNGSYDRFQLRFDREFLSDTDEAGLDEVIVHELLHVAMRDLDAALKVAFPFVPGADEGMWWERVKHEEEGLIQRLAVYIVSQHYEPIN